MWGEYRLGRRRALDLERTEAYFNDFVVHNGHAFGFDGSILACTDLKDGKRTWKRGRYGNGQLVLLPDQDVLLVRNGEEMAAFRLALAGG